MRIQQQEIAFTRHRLSLTSRRTLAHYLDPLIMAAISIFFIFLILKGYIEKKGNYDSPYFLLLSFFTMIALLFYTGQRRLLNLKQIDTNFSKHSN
jgi:hypothetical protein